MVPVILDFILKFKYHFKVYSLFELKTKIPFLYFLLTLGCASFPNLKFRAKMAAPSGRSLTKFFVKKCPKLQLLATSNRTFVTLHTFRYYFAANYKQSEGLSPFSSIKSKLIMRSSKVIRETNI